MRTVWPVAREAVAVEEGSAVATWPETVRVSSAALAATRTRRGFISAFRDEGIPLTPRTGQRLARASSATAPARSCLRGVTGQLGGSVGGQLAVEAWRPPP